MDNYNDFFNDQRHAPVVFLALEMGIVNLPESYPHHIALGGGTFTVYDKRQQKPLWSGNLNYARDVQENDFGAVSEALRQYSRAASLYAQFRADKYGKGRNEGIPRYSAADLRREETDAKTKKQVLEAAVREYLAQTDYAAWIDAFRAPREVK